MSLDKDNGQPSAEELVDENGSMTDAAESDAVPGVEEKSEPSLEEQLEAARAEAAEYLDGWQRARAEFANARKRLERQRAEAYRNAAVDYAGKLLPTLDDFDRALESVPEAIAADPWFAGLKLVRKKLESILTDLNVEPIQAKGQPFDPNYHEALAQIEVDGVEHGTVVEELQTGYRLGDRVIRPTLVNVAA